MAAGESHGHIRTAHELARELLTLPDHPVASEDGTQWVTGAATGQAPAAGAYIALWTSNTYGETWTGNATRELYIYEPGTQTGDSQWLLQTWPGSADASVTELRRRIPAGRWYRIIEEGQSRSVPHEDGKP